MKKRLDKTLLLPLIFLLSLLFSENIRSQNNFYTSKVTLNENQKSVSYVFDRISTQSGLKFSYNPKVIDDKRIISIKVYNSSVSDVLNQIFGKKVLCKQVGNYLVLTENIPPKKEIADNSQVEKVQQKTASDTLEEFVEKTSPDVSEKTPENSASESETPAPIKKNENENIDRKSTRLNSSH